MKKMISKNKPKKIALYSGHLSGKTIRDLVLSIEDEDIGSTKTMKGIDVPFKNIRKIKLLYKEN